MRILVTGASGFIGGHLARRLAAAGHEVVGMDLRPPDIWTGFRFVRGDVTSPSDCAEALSGCQVVYHLAARLGDFGPAAPYFKVNVDGTRTLLQESLHAKVSRFVFMSSVAVHDYARGYFLADEGAPVMGTMNAYAASKARGEALVRSLPGRMEWTIVRPALFPFGPGDETAFAPLARSLERGLLVLVAGGRAFLTTAYVDNLCHGLELCLSPEAAHRTFVLGDDEPIQWRDLLSRISGLLGVSPPRISVPLGIARALGRVLERAWRLTGLPGSPPVTEYRVLAAGRDCAFVSRTARRLLGYRPQVPLDGALAATVAWYRART